MGIDDKSGCLRIDQDWNGTQKVCQRKENVGSKDEEISNDYEGPRKLSKIQKHFANTGQIDHLVERGTVRS